jgi:6-phosphofructokinase 2
MNWLALRLLRPYLIVAAVLSAVSTAFVLVGARVIRLGQPAAAHELIDSGISQAVVVSLGSKGALLATRHCSQRFPAASVNVVSGVGAGDAMVAAITVGVTRGWSLSKSVRFGVATGAAMLMTPGTAPCRREDAERIFDLAPEPEDVLS